MKAVRVEQFGSPDVLRVAEIPAPELRDDEVFIELEAAGVNRLDLLVRSGGYHRGGQPPVEVVLDAVGGRAEARRNRCKVILEPNPRTSSVGATDAPSPKPDPHGAEDHEMDA